MNRRTMLLALAATGSAVACAALGWRFMVKRNNHTSLLVAGAGAMLLLNRVLAQAFSEKNLFVDVVVDQGGSLPGLLALKRGAIDIAAMSRDLTVLEDELSIRNFLIARNEISIMVNQASPLQSLSVSQIRALLSGAVTNWRDVGGPDASVHVISRTRGSTSRDFIEDVVLSGGDIAASAKEMETHQQLASQVAADPHAIGYIALNYQRDVVKTVKYLEVDGVPASTATVLSGRYPFTQSFYLAVKDERDGAIRDFIAFALSPAGQTIVAQQGFIPVAVSEGHAHG